MKITGSPRVRNKPPTQTELTKGICPFRLQIMPYSSSWTVRGTYQKYPDDETYPQLAVTYVRLDRVPRFSEDSSSIIRSLQAGDFFVTTGEVLLRKWGVEGSGSSRFYTADVEWTFPLEFAEVVWSDGKVTDRRIVRASELPPFGHDQFRIPFGSSDTTWVRFAVWDSAGDGAFTQPVHLR